MDLFLMSPPHPSFRLVGRANPSSATPEVDAASARAEWTAVARAIEARGGKVAVLAPREDLVELPFASDAGHPLPARDPGAKPRFLLSRMKPEHRRAEGDAWGPFVERLGFEAIAVERGTWEGQGDVVTFGRHTFLFYGGRTDREGLDAARVHFDGEVTPIEIEAPASHGNMAVLAIPHVRRLIVCADLVQDDSLALLEARVGRDRMHFVSSEEIQRFATNLIALGNALLAPSILPSRVRQLLARDGLEIVDVPMPELCEKAGGAARCLVCHVPDAPDTLTIPDDASIDAALARA